MLMPDAARLDDGDAGLAVKRIAHRDQRLKGVALLASRRADIAAFVEVL